MRKILAGWLLLAAAMFLPAARGCQKDIAGWEATRIAAHAQIDLISKIVKNEVIEEVEDQSLARVVLSGTFLTLINLGNACLILAPLLVWWLLRRHRESWFANTIGLCAVNAWLFNWGEESSFKIGYYAWFCCWCWVSDGSNRAGRRVRAVAKSRPTLVAGEQATRYAGGG